MVRCGLAESQGAVGSSDIYDQRSIIERTGRMTLADEPLCSLECVSFRSRSFEVEICECWIDGEVQAREKH